MKNLSENLYEQPEKFFTRVDISGKTKKGQEEIKDKMKKRGWVWAGVQSGMFLFEKRVGNLENSKKGVII